MPKETKEWKRWIFWFTLVIAAIGIYKLLDNFGDITEWIRNFTHILMPFIIAVILAYLFYIPCKKIEGMLKKSKVKFISKRSRWISIFIVYLIVLFVIVGIIKFVVPSIYESIVELVNSLPDYYNTLIY